MKSGADIFAYMMVKPGILFANMQFYGNFLTWNMFRKLEIKLNRKSRLKKMMESKIPK